MSPNLPPPAWRGRVVFNEAGLVPCVVQDACSSDVLMMAWMNADSLDETIASGDLVFWSRSRAARWRKGETSGNTQRWVSLHLDCDGDTLLARVVQSGDRRACHRGTPGCFDPGPGEDGPPPRHPLSALWQTVVERDLGRPEGSYTTRLLEGGVDRAGKKVGEEATEVVIAAKNAVAGRGTEELANESADLLYHLLVLWRTAGIDPADVFDVLSRRR